MSSLAGSGTAHLRGDDALLSVKDIVVEYRAVGGATLQAVSRISFDVMPGETIGIVGESGCGKSTTGRAVLRIEEIVSGEITFDGRRIDKATNAQMRTHRQQMQMIFQDPVGSLNPRRAVRDVVAEGLEISGVSKAHRRKVAEDMLERVGLPADRFGSVTPTQLSGGQAQRVAIARAIALRPQLIICDEPVSALDVSVQAQVLNILEELKQDFELTIVFIAHDLAVVRSVSDRIMVMYLGKVCEVGDAVEVYDKPAHPYTRALLDSVPMPDPDEPFGGPALHGDIPSPLNPPSGCRFRTRCPVARDVCAEIEPLMQEVRPGQFAACHFPLAEAG
ncbi:MAG: ABC transporter ATP-binding protein [Microbacterium sp.]|uniref:ABC transporter ATP-binding protein n=1 Tax=Microbacterium sp. TaxID=51671 RepID=UPI0039E40694